MPGLPFFLPASLPGGVSTYAVTYSDTGGAAGDLAALTDHCASGLALLIQEYQDSPLLKAWICSYLDRLQPVDVAIATAWAHVLSIETAEGVQLDLLGRIVREARDGRADDSYRRAIRVRILINRSQGRIEDLIQIASLFEDGAAITLREYQPARIRVTVDAPAINPTADLHSRLRRAKAAGVSLTTRTNPTAPSTDRIFLLGHATSDPSNVTTGLGWTGDSRGGYLSHVVG